MTNYKNNGALNKSTHFNGVMRLLLVAIALLSSQVQATVISQGLLVQLTSSDVSLIEQELKSVIGAKPISGIYETPIKTPYSFGNVTTKGIQYIFQANLSQLRLYDGGIAFELNLYGFQGSVRRMEFNESGSNYCANIPISGGVHKIPVKVALDPKVDAEGKLSFQIRQSTVELNEQNFNVQKPGHCDVLFGFNWLIKYVLPSVIESYKSTISTKIALTMAKSMEDKAMEISPYLALKLTMPFSPDVTPPFYAHIGVKPHRFDITQQRLQSFFETSVEIDPDLPSFMEETPQWPTETSFLGLSWDFFDGLLKEAQDKGLVNFGFPIKDDSSYSLNRLALSQIWPRFAEIFPSTTPLELRLIGGDRYQWHDFSSIDLTDHLDKSVLSIRNFKTLLKTESEDLAQFNFDMSVVFRFETTSLGKIKGTIESVGISRQTIQPLSARLVNEPWSSAALDHLIAQISQNIANLPEEQRNLFAFETPKVKIGSKQIGVKSLATSPAGLTLNLHQVAPN